MQTPLDPTAAYAAVAGRDNRWDGRLYLGVATTGIYCRPSCPARTPRPENCQYFPTAAAAVAAGFRACRRCRPDALPGSRHWDWAGDLAGRAVRLIADGALDSAGVPELAHRLALSPRHLTRLLTDQVGATPLQLARTRRAHTARMLIEQTALPLTDIAFAAGFGSIRQFNDVMRAEFGAAPRELRRPQRPGRRALDGERTESTAAPTLTLQLRYRPPLDAAALNAALTAHAIDGVERATTAGHLRVIDATHGPVIAQFDLSTPGTAVPLHLTLTDLRDITGAVARLRRWLDLDADPAQVDSHLMPDPLLGSLVAARPGLRVPGAVDGPELAVCTVLGQQVSLANARTFQSRIARAFGTPVVLHPAMHDAAASSPSWVTFPRPEVLAGATPQEIRDAANLTQARARTVHAIATACAEGLALTPGVDPVATRAALLAIPGIGPWSADYLALRALHDPDAFMPSDLVARKALAALTRTPLNELSPAAAERHSHPWQPWRAYALQHLWTATAYAPKEQHA